MCTGYRSPIGVEPEKPDEEPDPGRRIMPLSVSPSERREYLEGQEDPTSPFPNVGDDGQEKGE